RFWALALHWFQDLRVQSLQPDSFSLANVIVALDTAWQGALSLLAGHDTLADVVVYSAAISSCERAHEWEAALAVFDSMHRAGVSPNSITICAALSALAAGGKWVEALQLLPLCRREIIAVNATIAACAKASEWKTPLLLLSRLPEGVLPTVVTFSAVINACQRAGEWQQCLALFQEMAQHGLAEEDSLARNSCVKACAAAQQQQLAMQLLRRPTPARQKLRAPCGPQQ
ncbi:unnamed protein product, partial [Symbiodinium pilosum]